MSVASLCHRFTGTVLGSEVAGDEQDGGRARSTCSAGRDDHAARSTLTVAAHGALTASPTT